MVHEYSEELHDLDGSQAADLVVAHNDLDDSRRDHRSEESDGDDQKDDLHLDLDGHHHGPVYLELDRLHEKVLHGEGPAEQILQLKEQLKQEDLVRLISW